MDIKGLTNAVQNEIVETLRSGLTPTTNGTEIMDITTNATDSHEVYPVIRVVPSSISRDVDSESRQYTYTPAYTISVYLDIADADYPTSEIIGTLMELVDMIYDILDGHDYQSLPDGAKFTAQSSIVSEINTLQVKSGTVLYCDIQYPVGITIGL